MRFSFYKGNFRRKIISNYQQQNGITTQRISMQRHFLYPPRELPSRSLLQFMTTSQSRKRCELYRAYKQMAQMTRQEESTYILPGFLSSDMERDITFGDEAVLRAQDDAPSGDDNEHENTNSSNESSTSLGQADYEANHYEEADDLQDNDDDFGML